jgi:hypothetical protein
MAAHTYLDWRQTLATSRDVNHHHRIARRREFEKARAFCLNENARDQQYCHRPQGVVVTIPSALRQFGAGRDRYVQIVLAGFDFREIEDIVDDAKQRFA